MAKTPATSRAPYEGPANLNGKVAVVTGGSQGLGEAICAAVRRARRRQAW